MERREKEREIAPSSRFCDCGLVGFLNLGIVQAIQRHGGSVTASSKGEGEERAVRGGLEARIKETRVS
jgi:hypothetical protein